MHFCLIDRIVDLQPGVSIQAEKRLRPEEDYLRDHFPRFPVMPGVLMLEAMYQSAAWLIRVTENFRHSQVLLKEARNVKYADFVQPGETLTITAELFKEEPSLVTFKTQAVVHGNVAVSARLVLERFNLCDRFPTRAVTDAYTVRKLRPVLARLWQPQPQATAQH